MNSIHEYIFNDVKDIFIGKINSTKENSNYYDIIDSPSINVKDSNLIMIPKLMINKNNKRSHFNELLEVAYNKLKINSSISNSENENNFYHEIFYFYRKNNTNNLATKIYTIFPNVNFEFRQIKNLSFSNTNLNKYLISSKFKLPEMDENNNKNNKNEYNTGFFTMSQNHRLIALKDDLKECGNINKSQSLKEIIFGIWINLKEEKPTSEKSDLDFLFNKYKPLIYKQCFRFIKLSNNIETIYSPSPEENIFLLVIFYKGMQCHYEVKMSNMEEKNIYNNKNLINNNNCWLISKCKYALDEQAYEIPFDFDIKIEINNATISTMADYLNKKTKNNINNKENKNEIQENFNNKKGIIDNDTNIINNLNNKENINNKESKNNNFHKEINLFNMNNTSSDVFDLSDGEENNSIYGGYNYPLSIPNMNKNNSNNIINNQNKNDQNIYKKQHETSRASTNAHSHKPSLTSSKNSGKNNKSNVENINQINEEENIMNENSFDLINQYTFTIMKNSESIKKLENQVNKLEKDIIEIINKLEKNDNKKRNKKQNGKKEKRKIKKNQKEKENLEDKNNKISINPHDISNIGDISITVPRIIYKDLSITKDEL